MQGDPDADEVAARSARIRADAARLGATSWSEIGKAWRIIIDEKVEEVSRLEILAARLPASPGIAHGIGLARRNLLLLIEGHTRISMLVD